MALAATPTSSAPSMSLSSGNASGSGSNGAKTSDELRFSGHTLDKATKAKLTLENYYSTLISQHKERKERWKRLEESLRVSLCRFFCVSTCLAAPMFVNSLEPRTKSILVVWLTTNSCSPMSVQSCFDGDRFEAFER